MKLLGDYTHTHTHTHDDLRKLNVDSINHLAFHKELFADYMKLATCIY